MKRFIRTAMAVMLAVMAVACSNDEEQPLSECRGTVRVSIDGIINGYTTQDATRAVAENVVRIMWQGGETVYVYEGATCLGSLTATKGDDKGTYATLSGTINAPADGKTLTLVYSPQFTEEPAIDEDKLSLDLSTQDGKEVPFLIYATMPATEAPEISGASVHFDLATSVYKCNCTGLVAEGDITQAVIGEVNTVCELMLSDEGTPTVSGITPGNITRTAGFKAADQRAIFSVAVAKTDAATARTIEITKGGKAFGAAFDKGSLGIAAAYNTVLVLQEKNTPTSGTAKATIGGKEVDVTWVQLWAGGPKFAEYNIGATSVNDVGKPFAWSKTGVNDVAAANWGKNWRVPTKDELDHFVRGSGHFDIYVNGSYGKYDSANVYGFIFTGKGAYENNHLFFPARYVGEEFSSGGCWSGTEDDGHGSYMYLHIGSYGSWNRSSGSWASHWNKPLLNDTCFVRAVLNETPATTGTAEATINGVKTNVNWVQLWENGPKFAEYNVGAANNKPEDYGGYYAWGGSQNKVDDHNTGTSILSGSNDTATVLWGSNWRMPSHPELQGLLDNCDVVWTNVNGVNGRKFTGTGAYSSNSVFLPAAGDCYNGSVYFRGDYGEYWSSTPVGSYGAYSLLFGSGSQFVVSDDGRVSGYSVRAVLAE